MSVLACWCRWVRCEAQADRHGLRLGAALKQVFILEFDRRNAPIIIKRMHTQVTKKHASECCVQLGVLAYANLMHMMHSYVHLYAQVYISRHSTRYR